MTLVQPEFVIGVVDSVPVRVTRTEYNRLVSRRQMVEAARTFSLVEVPAGLRAVREDLGEPLPNFTTEVLEPGEGLG